jgi:WD40 repeat protein
VTADGKTCFTGHFDGTIHKWRLPPYPDHGAVGIVGNDPDVQVVLEQDGKVVEVVDFRTKKNLTLPPGEYTVKGDSKGGSVEVEPGRISIQRGDRVTVTVKRGLALVKRFEGPGRAGDVALSPDGKLALTGHAVGIFLWDLANGVEVARFEHSNVQDVTWSKDSKRLLSCGRDGTVRLWDVTTRQEIRQYLGHTDQVWAARISPDDRFVLTGCHDKKIRLFDLETGEEKKVLTGHDGPVLHVEFAPDGRRALSSDWNKTVRLWDLDKGQEIQAWTLDHKSRRVVWCSDGQRFLTCGEGNKVLLWDVNKKDPILSCEGHKGTIYDAVFTSDNRFAVSSSGSDDTVRFWDLKTGREVLRHHENLGEIYSIALSRDGRFLLTNGGWSKAARLYRLPQGLWPVEK